MVDVLAGIGMGRFLVRVRVSGVDLGEDALCPVERRPRACLFWFGQARVAEEHAVDVLGVLRPRPGGARGGGWPAGSGPSHTSRSAVGRPRGCRRVSGRAPCWGPVSYTHLR